MLYQPHRFKLWMTSLLRFGLYLSLALGVFSAHSAGTTTAQDTANDVVAVVNADPITRKTLADESLRRYGDEVLENMVNRHLILQACNSQGIEVTSTEVREEISRVAAKFGLSMQAYLQLLQEERDIAPDQYSREIIWPMLALRRLVADKVQVSQQEYDRAFLSQFGEAVKCRLIMVADRATADSLHQQAVAKPDQFASLAKQYSEDESSASVGGLIPPIRRYNGDSRLEDAAFALRENQVSDVLQLGDQWIILQAVRRIGDATPSPQAMPSIREQITDRIRDEKMRGAASELFVNLQREAQVVTVLGDEAKMNQYPGVAAIVNGQQVTLASVAAECIKRHGEEVLEGEIHRKMLMQALRKANQVVVDADLQEEVERAAISFGYIRSDGKADVDAWIESVTADSSSTRELYFRDAVWPSVAMKKLVEASVTLTEQDIQKGYDSAFGPRVEVLAVVLSDQRSAQKVWEMARDNPTDTFFGQLAEQYSVEPVSASNMGKVPPIRKHSGQPAIEREAFAMKPGDLSGIVVTGDKYIVMRCQGYTEPVVKDMAAVRDELIRDLMEKKTNLAMSLKFEQLKSAAEIDNFFVAAKEIPRVANASEGSQK
ncbi:peptidylprolyl isomerase [Novipirellula artificiosorum]|uniref:peptidylprolyl isomerase n=1 Tax=Novipirellula artificiosorum TaxID=2528016 RepID=A0A5C6DKC7_9BACT|nr:peptidylprolyl isomerase [Novipirellula artificiosorum]TWU36081.1 Foldase protein PrsA 3 precursor [Novipirellula artificiosorum]